MKKNSGGSEILHGLKRGMNQTPQSELLNRPLAISFSHRFLRIKLEESSNLPNKVGLQLIYHLSKKYLNMNLTFVW